MIQVTKTKDHELLATLNEEVQQLHHEMHPQIFKPFNKQAVSSALSSFVQQENCHAYVAWEDGVAVGYIILFVKESGGNAFHFNSRILYVDQMGVPARFRKMGIGQLLLGQAELLAGELFISRLELDHWSANTAAAAWFRKQGYELCKERLCKVL